MIQTPEGKWKMDGGEIYMTIAFSFVSIGLLMVLGGFIYFLWSIK